MNKSNERTEREPKRRSRGRRPKLFRRKPDSTQNRLSRHIIRVEQNWAQSLKGSKGSRRMVGPNPHGEVEGGQEVGAGLEEGVEGQGGHHRQQGQLQGIAQVSLLY